MKNTPTLRQFGQTTLPSSFLSKSSTPPPPGLKEVTDAKTVKKPVSLADFLNRKLGKTDGKSVQEKRSSFSSIGFGKDESGSKGDETGNGHVLDTAVFLGFKRPVDKERENCGRIGEEEVVMDSTWDCWRSRKRKNPFGIYSGDDERPSSPNRSAVLDNVPKPKLPQGKRRAKKPTVEKARPFYNHYENGSGLWDCDREGVDSEEVGCNEVWEGLGSTTIGGLEWH